MLAVLDLDPVLRPSGPIGPIRTLRHQALKAHVARRLEQVGADLALLIGCREDAVRRATGEQVGKVSFPRACSMRRVSAVCCRRTTLPSRNVQKWANRDCTLIRPFFVTPK